MQTCILALSELLACYTKKATLPHFCPWCIYQCTAAESHTGRSTAKPTSQRSQSHITLTSERAPAMHSQHKICLMWAFLPPRLRICPRPTKLMDSEGAELCFSRTDAALRKQAGIFDRLESPRLLALCESWYRAPRACLTASASPNLSKLGAPGRSASRQALQRCNTSSRRRSGGGGLLSRSAASHAGLAASAPAPASGVAEFVKPGGAKTEGVQAGATHYSRHRQD